MASALQEKVVLLVGRAGVGKSSIGNRILGRERFVINGSLYDDSQSTHGFGLVLHAAAKFHLHVFDSIGFEKSNRSKATKELKQYILDKGRPIHLVLFVFKKGRYTHEEKETFEHIKTLLGPQVSAISGLIITHCEFDSDAARTKLIEDMRSNELTKEITNYTKKGIFTVGFPQVEKMGIAPRFLPYINVNMEKDRDCILDLISESNSTVSAKNFFKKS